MPPSVVNGGASVIPLLVSGSAVVKTFSSDDADSLDSLESLFAKPLDSLEADISDSEDELELSKFDVLPRPGRNWKQSEICQWEKSCCVIQAWLKILIWIKSAQIIKQLTGLANTTARSATSSAVLNVHILQVKKVTIKNGCTVKQLLNKHNIPGHTKDLKLNVTLLQCSVHVSLCVCFWAATVYIAISCEIRVGLVRNPSSLINEWCSASFEQYPPTSDSRQCSYLICIITVWKSKH